MLSLMRGEKAKLLEEIDDGPDGEIRQRLKAERDRTMRRRVSLYLVKPAEGCEGRRMRQSVCGRRL